MIILALFIFAALAEMPVWTSVVDSFTKCNNFFFRAMEPRGMDQNAKKICQKLNNEYFYASLYSTYHRIPVYSAYTFDRSCNNQYVRKSNDWYIEPQISGFPQENMQENKYEEKRIKSTQALNCDYSNTGYDRGHLNPNSFQCNTGRNATFTLTNSAPMDACFNRVHWYQWEKEVKTILRKKAVSGMVYLVTGTVPSPDFRIPIQGEFDVPGRREYGRVTVPTRVWTAVCYDDTDAAKSFSFGYIGLNQPDSKIKVMTVPQLSHVLAELYNVHEVEIFKDACFSSNRASEEIVKTLYKKIQLPLSDKLTMSENYMNVLHTALGSFGDDAETPSKKPRVTEMEIQETYDSLEHHFSYTESMKYVSGYTCALSQPFTGPINSQSRPGVQNQRNTVANSHDLVCSIVPEHVPQCISSCLYKKEARDYYCSDGAKEKSCSPIYSGITVRGSKCKSDHTCGKHGEKYYWCWESSSWDYCSPPLPMGKGLGRMNGDGSHCRSNHNCGWYGSSYTWCYTDYSNNWDHCCRVGDRYAALNGRTCKPDHPCDYHSYTYLWCYTTDGSWDYCCTNH